MSLTDRGRYLSNIQQQAKRGKKVSAILADNESEVVGVA
jgi:hypothetical protein